jgi:hypothetical protein
MATNRIFEIMDFESDVQNFKVDFKVATKRYGREFISIVKAMWEANDGVQTEEEFCEMNCNMPKGFFENKIR